MKFGFFVTFFVVTVKGFETSGDGRLGDGSYDDDDTVVNNVINVHNVVNIVIDPGTSSAANIVIDSGLCAGKCDSYPNTECMIVKSNSIGYVRWGINFATKSMQKRIYSCDGLCSKHKYCHIFEPFYILYFLSSKPRVMRKDSKI